MSTENHTSHQNTERIINLMPKHKLNTEPYYTTYNKCNFVYIILCTQVALAKCHYQWESP